MTDKEKRIFIAEACGWSYRGSETGWFQWFMPDGSAGNPASKKAEPWWDRHTMPDYLNSRDAIHTALQSRLNTRQLRNDFLANLWDVLGLKRTSTFWTGENIDTLCYAVIDPTARQLSKAFIRTIQP